ncbi:hypothetical protein BSZ36_14495 [Rubricoccus marinus]|uniref:Uncharacterized protein n=1 Tax=Rubricoccus marinus TaxID=716817 RepID=A0A259U3Z5_9BACT|nr:hypothetical protein BSZ36_14495 [Rubricoccus marinus]
MQEARRQRHREKWIRLAPAGLVGVGLGVSLVGEATLRKGRGESYVAYGTLALCVLNAGLCLFGEGVKHSVLADRRARNADEE